LLWQSETAGDYDIAHEVASGAGTIAAAGEHLSSTCVGGVGCGIDAALRVYDASTGAPRWTRNFDFNRTFDIYNAVAIAGRAVIAAGYTRNVARTFGHDWWIINAYDLDSGELLWHEMLGDSATDYFPWQIAVKGDNVVVTGIAGGDCATGPTSQACDQFTRAYDARSGRVLWTNRVDKGGDEELLSVDTTGNLVFVGGAIAGSTSGKDGSDVRAYDARTGALVWEDVIRDPTGDGFVFKVVARGDRVFVAAINNDDWLIRAYNARTGAVEWTTTYNLLGASVPVVYDGPVQMAVGGDVLAVGGYGSTQVFGTEPYPKASRDWVVRAYDVKTGQLLWSDVHGAPNDIDEVDGGVTVANGQVFALGFISTDDGRTHTELRAYDAKNGTVVWDDIVDRDGLPLGVTITLAAADGQLR
jgi:glucose dehydrogenase